MADTGGFINVNNMVQSFYNNALNINQAVSNMVGIDVQWMRAVPVERQSDVIFQEHTLYNVDCPVDVRVVASNSDYNPGNFNIDYFGIEYDAPFEIQVDKTTWENAFGHDVMPQKGDIVYIKLMNLLFEVATSTIIYGFGERETGYKVNLKKYTPRAIRRENGVHETIDDLTVGIEELFGDDISREVADIVDPEQTDMNNNTVKRDVFKTADLRSVVIEDVFLQQPGIHIARSYYNMEKATETVIYQTGDEVSKGEYRLLTAWVRMHSVTETESVTMSNQRREGSSIVYDVTGHSRPAEGEGVDLSKGNFYIHGTVSGLIREETGETWTYAVAFNQADALRMKRRITNWDAGTLRSTRASVIPVLMGRHGSSTVFNASIVGTGSVYVKSGDDEAIVSVPGGMPANEWFGLAILIGPQSKVWIMKEDQKSDDKLSVFGATLGKLRSAWQADTMYITASPADLTNIRYYSADGNENEQTVRRDLTNITVTNASRVIISDQADIPNDSPYIGQQR